MTRPRWNRGRRAATPAVALAASIAVAATIGTAIYLVSTSLPYLVNSASADPRFGALNHCLISQLREPRAGFAVSPDGTRAAAYGASSVAVCMEPRRGSQDGGTSTEGKTLPLAGVTSAAFDFEGTLWLAAARGPRPELWVLRQTGEAILQRIGDFAPVAVAGLAKGVAALNGEGKVAVFSVRSGAAAWASLPPGATSSVQLATNADGSLVAAVAPGTVHIFRAADLSLVRAESPCDAEFLWWLPDPSRALIACGPSASWALTLQVITGERESAPKKERPRSALIPLLGVYVQSCEQLPCSTQPP